AYRDGLTGRTLVVFGGGYGIGAQIVEMAKGYGAAVHSFSRARNGVRVEDPAGVADALTRVYGETGRIDYVVNAASALHIGRLDEPDPQVVEETVGVNYLGPINVARASFKYLAETGGHLLLYTPAPYPHG